MKLSTIVIAKDEEERISACLESAKWANELVVVMDDSVDNTAKIAKKYTNEVLIYKGEHDFAKLRNWAMEQTLGEWVLFLDADERILSPLKEEIVNAISGSEKSAFAIPRKNIIFGTEKKYGPFWPDFVIRLLKRENFTGWAGKIHEQPTFEGSLGYLKNPFLHLTHRDLNQIICKSLDWSNIDAKLRLSSNHPKISSWRLIRILLIELFNQGFLRKGFFAGTIGTMDAILQTFSLVMTYIRLWEMQQSRPLDRVYAEIDKKLIDGNFKF